MDFFNRLKRIIGKHSTVAKVYFAVLTVLLTVCVALGLAAYEVPYGTGENSGAEKAPYEQKIVKVDETKEETTPEEQTEEPAYETPEPDDYEITETGTASQAQSDGKVERIPAGEPSETESQTFVPTAEPIKTPVPTPTPSPTPVPTPTPEPTPVVTLKWKDIPEQVDFGVTYIEDHTMCKGTSRVVSEGEYGIKTTVWEFTLVDGVEQSRRIVAIKDTKTPVNKVVAVGTIDSFTDNQGRVVGMAYKIDGDATAYGNSVKYGNQIYYGKELGGLTTRWGVIAVDPTVIPLGTKVYVQGVNGVNDYGYAIAGDIGGAIKGKRIDLWMENRDIIKIWGVRDVTIYILADQTVDVFELRGEDSRWIPPAKYKYTYPDAQ